MFLAKDEGEPFRTTVSLVNAPAVGVIPAVKELDVDRGVFADFAPKGGRQSGEEPSRPSEYPYAPLPT